MRKMIRRSNKYRAKATEVDGIRFDSRAEAARYGILKLWQMAGIISGLELQPKFKLTKAAISYRADFIYTRDNGQRVVEDVKGVETDRFRMIKKLWQFYGPYTLIVTKKSGSGFVVKEAITPDAQTGFGDDEV